MAYNELYIQPSGSNVNAGSNANNAADVSQTNGSWDITADTFIATAATPFSAVNVGDWASIYNDAAATAVYVAQVTSINSGGLSITLSTTAKYGTKPAAGATGKSCKVGGAWASEAAFINLGTTAVYNDTRINWKVGTYANTTTSRQYNPTGSATATLHWRGYNTTIGDCDDDPTLARPQVTFTTGTCTLGGSTVRGVYWSSINQTSSRTAGAGCIASGFMTMERSQFVATGANALSSAMSIATSQGPRFVDCYFNATSTATRTVQHAIGTIVFTRCIFTGGGHGLDAGAAAYCFKCVFRSNGGSGWNQSSASLILAHDCTFYAAAADGITAALAFAQGSEVRGCVFVLNGGFAINNSSGVNTDTVNFSSNTFNGNVSGKFNGFGGVPDFNEIVEASNPITSATNMTLVPGASSYGKPVAFEGETYTTYRDIGPVQHQDVGGGPVGRITGARSIGTY